MSLGASFNPIATSKQGSRVAEELEGKEADLHAAEVSLSWTLTDREVQEKKKFPAGIWKNKKQHPAVFNKSQTPAAEPD